MDKDIYIFIIGHFPPGFFWKFKGRRSCIYIPFGEKILLKNLGQFGSISPSNFTLNFYLRVVQKIESEIAGEILVQNDPKVNTMFFSPNDIIDATPQLKFQSIRCGGAFGKKKAVVKLGHF